MKKVSVTEAKNGLSRLLAEVAGGESVLIVHRGTPVARIVPYQTGSRDDDQTAADLIRREIADPPAASFSQNSGDVLRALANLMASSALIDVRPLTIRLITFTSQPRCSASCRCVMFIGHLSDPLGRAFTGERS